MNYRTTMDPLMRTSTFATIAFASSLCIFSAACGDDQGDDPDRDANNDGNGALTEPADDACEHAQEGPFVEVAATETAAGAPAIDTEHTAFQISLPDAGDGTFRGQVAYTAAEAGDYVVFLSDASAVVTVSVADDASGAELAAEETQSVGDERCVEINEGLTYDLEAATYTLAISSTDPLVTVVVVHAGDQAHDE